MYVTFFVYLDNGVNVSLLVMICFFRIEQRQKEDEKEYYTQMIYVSTKIKPPRLFVFRFGHELPKKLILISDSTKFWFYIHNWFNWNYWWIPDSDLNIVWASGRILLKWLNKVWMMGRKRLLELTLGYQFYFET